MRRARLTFIAITCLFVISCTRDFKANSEKFDSAKWKTHDLRERGRMTDDLLAHSLLVGKSPMEVRSLLGEPENITKAGLLEYETDPGAWLGGANNGPWIHYLIIEFGSQDGRAIKAYIID